MKDLSKRSPVGSLEVEVPIQEAMNSFNKDELDYMLTLLKYGDHAKAADHARIRFSAEMIDRPHIRKAICALAPTMSKSVNAKMMMPYILDALNKAALSGEVSAAKVLFEHAKEKAAKVQEERPWVESEKELPPELLEELSRDKN